MRDKNGKRLSTQQMQRPRWPAPYSEPIEVAGFTLLKYLGYRRYGNAYKGAHWYLVQCLGCSTEYERYQGSLVQAVKKGTRGCNICAKKRFAADKRASKEAAQWLIMHSLYEWNWANFLMPVTSLRMRDEIGRSFDTEKAKVMGWHLI